MTLDQINKRIKEINIEQEFISQQPIDLTELERDSILKHIAYLSMELDFLYDQLLNMRTIANDINSSALEIMNGGEQHV